MTQPMDSPTGIDINPRPPAAMRVRRSVGVFAYIGLGLLAVSILYGMRERQQRQVQSQRKDHINNNATPASPAVSDYGHNPIFHQAPGNLDNGIPDLDPPYRGAPSIDPLGGRGFTAQPAAPSFPRGIDEVYDLPNPQERAEQAAIDSPMTVPGGRSAASNLGGLPPPVAPALSVVRELSGPSPVSSIDSSSPREAFTVDSLGAMPSGGGQSSNGQAEMRTFLAQARTRAVGSGLPLVRTAPLSRFEIKTGWDIPATLEQAINSDQPGEIRALVRSNVYDTASGQYVLIPQGSRLVGSYNSNIAFGQDGVQAVWDRIIFPDGSTVDLNGMVGQDAKGQSGLRHDVDHHYPRLVGFAVLTSLFSAGFQLSQSRAGSVLSQPSAGQVVAGAVGGQVSQLGVEITRKNLNVQPTIRVPAGYRFNVRVSRDIVFEAPYFRLR